MPKFRRFRYLTAVTLSLFAVMLVPPGSAEAGLADPVQVTGEQRLLVVAVRFRGTKPQRTLAQIRKKADGVARYIRMASYGKASLRFKIVGWYDMPAGLAEYKVSPQNFDVDRKRVRRLLSEALGAVRRDVKIGDYDEVWIVVGARTMPGQGYGMIAYCANPGMLSGVRSRRSRMETIKLVGGGSYSGPVIVSAENAHTGHASHDLLHALGGAKDGNRVVPDLYDFELQSRPPAGAPFLPSTFAIHVGPWDIMSQHFVERMSPPPPPSSFTRLQLGWIKSGQFVDIAPGESRRVTLRPLAAGKGIMVARVRLDANHFVLIENRQPIGGDKVLPSSGMLVLKVNRNGTEGRDIVEAVDANPSTRTLNDAPFQPDAGELRAYVDKSEGVAVRPLALRQDSALDILVTTPKELERQAQ